MNKKEMLETLLQQVDESERAPLVEKLRVANKEQRVQVLEEAGIKIPDDWKGASKSAGDFEVSDEDMDMVAGGCWTDYCCSGTTDCCD